MRRRKRLAAALILVVAATAVFIVLGFSILDPGTARVNDSLRLYLDPDCLTIVDESQISHVWSVVDFGWNPRTFWVRNAGPEPFYLGFETVVPEGWFLKSNYNKTLIQPEQKLSVTLSLYVPDQPGTERALLSIRFLCIFESTDGSTPL